MVPNTVLCFGLPGPQLPPGRCELVVFRVGYCYCACDDVCPCVAVAAGRRAKLGFHGIGTRLHQFICCRKPGAAGVGRMPPPGIPSFLTYCVLNSS